MLHITLLSDNPLKWDLRRPLCRPGNPVSMDVFVFLSQQLPADQDILLLQFSMSSAFLFIPLTRTLTLFRLLPFFLSFLLFSRGKQEYLSQVITCWPIIKAVACGFCWCYDISWNLQQSSHINFSLGWNDVGALWISRVETTFLLFACSSIWRCGLRAFQTKSDLRCACLPRAQKSRRGFQNFTITSARLPWRGVSHRKKRVQWCHCCFLSEKAFTATRPFKGTVHIKTQNICFLSSLVLFSIWIFSVKFFGVINYAG